ncbi:MHYT domain-containing protein, partial [Micromonospora zamorensis]
MAEINHFEYGWITPALSYALSVLGSILGLVCAGRIRRAQTNGQRAWWGLLSAWALGGTAIWAMHFMAMLGFAVENTRIRYDVPLTVASTAIAVVAVGIGLAIVGTGRLNAVRLIAGGIFTGAGVASMHYTGMAAMRLNGSLGYDTVRVVLSVVIAVVASTVALWLAMTVRRGLAIFASALVMGVAVNGMHFTGMSALSVHRHERAGEVTGAGVSTLLVPIMLAVIFGVVGLLYALLAAPTDDDRAAAAYLDGRRVAEPAAATP